MALMISTFGGHWKKSVGGLGMASVGVGRTEASAFIRRSEHEPLVENLWAKTFGRKPLGENLSIPYPYSYPVFVSASVSVSCIRILYPYVFGGFVW